MQPKVFTLLEKATPIWFNWLGWFLSTGAIGFIAEKTQLVSVFIVYGISYLFFFMYITHIISKINDIKLIKSENLNKVIMSLVAIMVMGLSTITLNQAISALMANG